MSKLKTVFVVAQNISGMAELTAGAAQLGENIEVVFAGDKDLVRGTRTLYSLGSLENKSYLDCIPSVVSLVKEKKPQLVLLETTKNGRVMAAAIAAAMGTSVMTDISELAVEEDALIGKRMVYGGAAFQTFKASGKIAVACVSPGVFEAAEEGQKPEEIIELSGAEPRIKLRERRQKTGQTVNLNAAKYVVGVGRGIGQKENLKSVREFADAIGGEVGCSRPVAEEDKWLPVDSFIGISGTIIKPDIYIACGISGQVQHMTGVSQARTIIAINKEKSAPIFEKCDYGIIGDLNNILPALTQKLKG